MKTALVSAVILALAGGTWTWVTPNQKFDTPKSGPAFDADERVGLRRMLDAREDLELVNLVIGTDGGELRDFRARLVEDGHARPVFGQARRTCDSGPGLAECWEIAHLHVDGKLRNLSISEASAPTLRDTLPVEVSDDAEIETGEIPSAETASPRKPEAPLLPRATHLVARPIINARSGPGLANPVLFKLSQGARLELIAEDRGWGKSVVLDGDNEGTEAWASLSILETLR